MCLHNTKSNSTNFKTSLQSITSAVTAMQGIKAGAYIGSNGLFDTATVNAYRASIKGLSATQAEAALSASGLTAAQRQQILTSKESTVANAGQATSFNVLTKAVWANVKAMAKWLVTTPTGWITLAIGATAGLIAAYNNVEKKQNELIENARNLQEEYRSFAKDTAGKITSLEGQAEEFNKLAKGVDKYGNNISLASDEYDRYKSIVAEILGYSPELIQGYDAEGNAIADKNGLLERSIELLKEEQRLKLKEMTTDEKTGEAYDAAEAGWQQVQGYKGANTRNEIARWFDNNALRGGVNYEVDIAKVLGIKDEWKEEGNNLQNAIINNIDTVVKNIKDKKAELLAISDSDGNAIFSVDEIDNMIDLSNDWQYAYNQWQQDIEDAKHGMDDQFDLYAQRAKSYSDLTDAQKVFVNEYIRATGDITDAEGHLLSEDKILEKAKGYEKFVNEFAELNKLGEGGSVDLTFRPEIDTEELNKKGWEAGEGFATVFSSAISNTDFEDLMPTSTEDTVAINFTPIIVDPNTGEFKGVLSEEELYAYAHDVLAGVREDDLNLQIGAKFKGKNAIDEAVADGERIHYLHEKLFINNDTVDSWEELRKVLVKTGDDAVQAGEKVDKMTVSIGDLEKASDGIKTLGSAFKELSDDGCITTKTLSEIKAATGLSDEAWKSYETTLMNAKVGSTQFNEAMSDLTYKILEEQIGIDKLTNADEDYIAAVLRENGVLNASAVAHDAVVRAKATSVATSITLETTTDELKQKLADEATACGISERAFYSLVASEIVFNNTQLSVHDKITQLKNIATAAGLAKGAIDGVFGTSSTGNWAVDSLNQASAKKDFIEDPYGFVSKFDGLLASSLDGDKYNFTAPQYSGGSSSSGSSSDKNEALDNYLKYAESRYKIHQDETKYINDLIWAQNNLVKSAEEELEVTEKVNEAYRDLADNRIKDIEHQIEMTKNLKGDGADVTEYYKQIQAIAHEEANRLRGMGYDDNSNEIQELQKQWWDAQNNIDEIATRERESLQKLASAHSEAYSSALRDRKKLIEELEHQKALTSDDELIKNIDKQIVDSMTAGITEAQDAISKLTNDADYWKGVIAKKLEDLDASFDISKWFDDEGNLTAQFESDMAVLNNSKAEEVISTWADTVSDKLKGVAENTQLVFEYQEEIFSKSREAIEESISIIQEAAEEIFDLRTSKLNSQSSLLQSHHDLINSIAETQHQLDKDILEAETAGARMTERERELLFTREEYNELSGKLNDVLAEANDIQDEFNRKLQNATLDTIDEITNHYERQYELKMKEYEVIQKELEVAKAQQKLENVENEKSVRQWDGEKWIYTAVLQDVINAQNELADAKYQLAQTELEQSQTEAIHEIDAKVDAIETKKNLFITALEELTGSVTISEEKLAQALQTIADNDLETFKEVIDTVGDTLNDLVKGITSGINTSNTSNSYSGGSGGSSSGLGSSGVHPSYNGTATIPGVGVVGVNINSSGKTTTSLPKGSIVHTSGGNFKITGGTPGNYTTVPAPSKTPIKKYATGSRSTSKGLGLYDENGLGTEALITNDGVLRQFDSGDTVFTEEMVGRLWDFASNNPIPWNFPVPNFSSLPALVNRSEVSQPVYDNSITLNGIEIKDAEGIRIMKDFATYLKSKV